MSTTTTAPAEETDLVRWFECGRKVRYESMAEADATAWETMRKEPVRNNGVATNLYAYECRWCDGFHYGKRPTRLHTKTWRQRVAAAREWHGRVPGRFPAPALLPRHEAAR